MGWDLKILKKRRNFTSPRSQRFTPSKRDFTILWQINEESLKDLIAKHGLKIQYTRIIHIDWLKKKCKNE